MAALKFLALAVQVRILVSQPQTKPTLSGPASAFLIGVVVTPPVIYKYLRINNINKISLSIFDREISFYFLIIKNL